MRELCWSDASEEHIAAHGITPGELEQIAAHAQGHDFAEEMAGGAWEDDTVAGPMVTTSLRLPKSLLD